MKASFTTSRIGRGPVRCCTEAEFAAKLRAVVGEKVCTVSTVSAEGQPECAVVGFALTPEGKMVLHTHKFSRKWENLQSNPAVALSISAGIYAPYFQIEGTAQLFGHGERHQLLEEIYSTEHPKAAALANAFTTGTILVTPRWARYFEWPRKSGHCIEWMIDEGPVPKGNTSGLILRNAYEDEDHRIWKLLDQLGMESSANSGDFALLAEENGEVVGAIFLKLLSSVGLVISGPHIDRRVPRKRVGTALAKLASQVVHSQPCLALTSTTDQEAFIQCGFSLLPTQSRTAAIERLLTGVDSASSGIPLAINWQASASS